MTRNDQRAIAAEFLATLYFVFLGCGSVVAAVGYFKGDSAPLVAIAIAHGIGILTAVAWTANLSGGHINPAVSLAMIVAGKIKPALGVAYMVAQMAGAAVGALLLKLVTPSVLRGSAGGNLGLHSIAKDLDVWQGLVLEIILTAFLVLVIFNVAVSKKGWGANAPIAIGLAVMLIHFVAIPATGASVNPARSFGPALAANEWKDFWVYVVGPAIGGVLVALFWTVWKGFGEDKLDDVTA